MAVLGSVMVPFTIASKYNLFLFVNLTLVLHSVNRVEIMWITDFFY